jgi:hypothetical protein
MTPRSQALEWVRDELISGKESLATGNSAYDVLVDVVKYVDDMLAKEPDPVFWLVVDDKVNGWAVLGPWSKKTLVTYIHDKVKAIRRMFIFEGGERVMVSQAPFQHVLFRNSPPEPIYKPSISADTADDGSVVDDDVAPRPSNKPKSGRSGADAGDGFGS